MFLLFPEVEIAKRTSPFFPNASTPLENIFSYPKSLPQHVKNAGSDKAIAANAFLSSLKRPDNSSAKWAASHKLPPLPQERIFFHF